MQRSQLEHLIRAAAEITNQYEFVIVGSQSILGVLEWPPPRVHGVHGGGHLSAPGT